MLEPTFINEDESIFSDFYVEVLLYETFTCCLLRQFGEGASDFLTGGGVKCISH